MSIKLTKLIVNERLKDRGISLSGEYVSALSITQFSCVKNHTWQTTAASVMHGTGCPDCDDDNKRLTTDLINERLLVKGITLLDSYSGQNKDKHKFRCQENHEWVTDVGSVLRGSKCPVCFYNKKRLTTEEIQLSLKDRSITLIGDYSGSTREKHTFKCAKNHIWQARLGSILQGISCSACSTSGFNKEKSAHLYILEYDTFLKYGITNVLDVRLKRHKRNGKYRIITTKFFESGTDALNLENKIKTDIGGNFVTKEVCADGFTETLALDKIQELMKLLE